MNGRRRQLPPGLRPGLCSALAAALGLLSPLVALLLILSLEAVFLPVPVATALSLPWRHDAPGQRPAIDRPSLSALQEVSPPEAVQQLQAALGARQPVLEILSPQPDSLLPAGPWTLRLDVHDWPLVDAGALGLGPHLVVQLDQEPPQIWTRSEGELPELSPGSHRLTVYAAQPWGEARKTPGAVQQIRLHRTAANPQALPAPGSPQLLAVSPTGPAGAQPLLLDWLLLDAPLQDVGGSGTQWRLRVSINDDTVLLEQQSPLWLRGWRPGRNAVRLELLDGRGEPLNPPFNSLVQEVDLGGRTEAPRWRGGPLTSEELAILVGEAPVPAPGPGGLTAPAQPPRPPGIHPGPGLDTRAGDAEPAAIQRPPASRQQTPGAAAISPAPDRSPDGPTPSERPQIQSPGPSLEPTAVSAPAVPRGALPEIGQAETAPVAPGKAQLSLLPGQHDQPVDLDEAGGGGSIPTLGSAADASAGALNDPSATTSPRSSSDAIAQAQAAAATEAGAPAPSPLPAAASPLAAQPGSEAQDPPRTSTPSSMSPASAAPAITPAPPADPTSQEPQIGSIAAAAALAAGGGQDRIRAGTELTGRARDLVNDDGTLRRPERQGPLAALRERLQR